MNNNHRELFSLAVARGEDARNADENVHRIQVNPDAPTIHTNH